MTKKVKIAGFNTEILKIIKKSGITYNNKLALELKRSTAIISQHLNILEREGYIKRIDKGILTEITLTSMGNAYVQEVVDNLSKQPLGSLLADHPLKLHKVALAFKLRTPLNPKDPAMIIRSAGMSYTPSGLKHQESGYSHYESYTLYLTTEHLILYLPQLEVSLLENPYLAFRKPIELAIDKALELEAMLKQPLYRLDKDTLVAYLIFNENAMTNNELAKNVLENKQKLNVFDEHGILRLKIDESPPRGLDLEAVFAQNSVGDIAAVSDHYLAVLTGKLDYVKDHELLHNLILLASKQQDNFTQFGADKAYTDRVLTDLTKQLALHLEVEQKQAVNQDLMNLRLNQLGEAVGKLTSSVIAQPKEEKTSLFEKVKKWLGR